MKTKSEIKKRLEELKESLRKDDPVWHWSGHIDGEISALEWVLEEC